MKLWKKCASLLLAFALTAPCVVMSACGDSNEEPNNGTNTEQNGGTQTPETPENPAPETPENPEDGKLAKPSLYMDNSFARWTAVPGATKYIYKRGENEVEKETTGLYVKLNDGQTLFVKAIGNDIKDSDWASISYTYTDPYIAPPEWARRPTLSSFTSGTGTEYNRFDGTVGYYEINLTAGKEVYYSFSVPQSGQYALVTNEKKTGLSITRYDASTQYLGEAHPAKALENGTLYSYVHCNDAHFNEEWRATYKISCTTNGKITIRFVRVADPLPLPERHVTNVPAQEIVGKTQDLSSAFVPVEVPWLASDEPQYFYDADYEMTFNDLKTGEEKTAKGFYRMGTEENPGEVIYAAITSAPSRYLGAAFSTIQYERDNLTLHIDTDVDGNYHFNSYIDFIMNNGGLSDNSEEGNGPLPGDSEMLCYMNVANKDGMFPVNQELFEFLSLYTSLNKPVLDDGVNVDKKDYWLAPCYYYVEQELGSKKNPIQLELGENTISLEMMVNKYYTLALTDSTTYTITGSNGLIAFIDGTNYGVAGTGFTYSMDVSIDTNTGNLLIELKTLTTGDYTLTITDTPIIDVDPEEEPVE